MQIEIAEPGRMTQTGSSLIRLIQNNNMPVLDLLVRESIQNSLDARKPDSKYVEVDYITGSFNSGKLGNELELLTGPLSDKYGTGEYEFVAIRDYNTTGLTGEMNYKKVKDNAYGNLLKLVYEICKPQENEGAGGSWGIGKTVYFRIGIGLVIYYSRIKNNDGSYESRLAASLVENETDADAMIPEYKGMSKRGIAWWGKKVDENETQPVTDEEYIEEFLKIFNIEEYKDDKTGTTIIIPYIKSKDLLSNNRIEYLNDQEQPITPFWCNRLEDYLSISAQRWYAPRLNNTNYQQGAYLRMKINNLGVSFDSMEPIFKVVQALYNSAVYVDDYGVLDDVEKDNKFVEKVSVRNVLQDSQIGVLACAKVSRDILCMNAPDNKPNPNMYFNNEIRDTEVNRPTICYTRKPAMIVAYENDSSWVSKMPSSDKDEYIIGIFVLNSYNKLKDCQSIGTLEEYIRKSEMADHTSWNDWSEGAYNPRLVSRIQQGINKLVSNHFSGISEEKKPKVNSGYGKLFGDMLLPPEGFGKGANPDPKPRHDDPKNNRRKSGFSIDIENIKYQFNTMIIPLILEASSRKKISGSGFYMMIDSESKRIDINEWEEKMSMNTPFSLVEYRIYLETLDGVKINESIVLKDEDLVKFEDFTFAKRVTSNGTCNGLSIRSADSHSLSMRIEAVALLNRNDIKPVFVFDNEV